MSLITRDRQTARQTSHLFCLVSTINDWKVKTPDLMLDWDWTGSWDINSRLSFIIKPFFSSLCFCEPGGLRKCCLLWTIRTNRLEVSLIVKLKFHFQYSSDTIGHRALLMPRGTFHKCSLAAWTGTDWESMIIPVSPIARPRPESSI